MPYQEINEQYLWQQRLAPLLTYLPEDHIIKVREALSLGYDAHIKQKRKSGEPFITHPVEVTRILAELQMDYESLIAGQFWNAATPLQPNSYALDWLLRRVLTRPLLVHMPDVVQGVEWFLAKPGWASPLPQNKNPKSSSLSQNPNKIQTEKVVATSQDCSSCKQSTTIACICVMPSSLRVRTVA